MNPIPTLLPGSTCRLPHRRLDTFVSNSLASRVQFWAEEPSPLERLMARHLARALKTFTEPHFNSPLRRAANEAGDLAEATGFPLLVFPELFAELAIAALLEAEYEQVTRGGATE